MGIDTGLYELLLVLHLVAVVVGFGTVALNGVYGARAKAAGGAEGLAIARANSFVSERIAERVIWTVPVLGLALVGVSDGVWSPGQTWIWLSLALYGVGLAISRLVLAPSERRMLALTDQLVAAGPPTGAAAGPPPQVAELGALEKKMAAAGTTLNLIVVVIIALMVVKPGF